MKENSFGYWMVCSKVLIVYHTPRQEFDWLLQSHLLLSCQWCTRRCRVERLGKKSQKSKNATSGIWGCFGTFSATIGTICQWCPQGVLSSPLSCICAVEGRIQSSSNDLADAVFQHICENICSVKSWGHNRKRGVKRSLSNSNQLGMLFSAKKKSSRLNDMVQCIRITCFSFLKSK